MSCPDDEDRAGEGALLVGPLEQLLGLGDVAEALGEVAADLGVVAQRMDPTPEQVVGNPPLGQGAEGEGGSLQTSVTWRRSNSVRNPAIMVASAGRERVVQVSTASRNGASEKGKGPRAFRGPVASVFRLHSAVAY